MSTEPVRIIYDNSNQTGFPEHHGKVFAVIGPFDGHLDKVDLQKAIERVLVEHNSAIGHGPGEEVRAGYGLPSFKAVARARKDIVRMMGERMMPANFSVSISAPAEYREAIFSLVSDGHLEEVEIHGRKGYRKGPNFPAPFNPSEEGDSCVTFL